MALAENYRTPLQDLSFAQSSIQRPLTELDDPDLLTKTLSSQKTKVMLLSERGSALGEQGLEFLSGPSYRSLQGERQVLLGSHEGINYVVALVESSNYPQILSERWISLREGFTQLDPVQAELFVEAQAIANWIRMEQYCPRCGSEVKSATFGWGQRCVKNDHELFPRTDPAVIASVIDSQDRILLGANANFRSNMYSILAGFVEAGESLESAVRREIFEESGVHVGDVAYRGSQPWPLPRSLMLGFTAQALSTDLVPDGAEIKDLRWFSRAELSEALTQGSIQIPRGTSISHALIRNWYGQELPEAVSK